MMISSQTQFRHLKMQVQRKLAETLQLAENHFQRKFPIPTISYDLRGVKAGVAYLQKNEIKFNRTLLLENSDEFIHQVVPHELAHLIVYSSIWASETAWKGMASGDDAVIQSSG